MRPSPEKPLPKRFDTPKKRPEAFLRDARWLICLKADERHKYKYPAAILEDYRLVSAEWRPHMLAAAVYIIWRAAGSPTRRSRSVRWK